MYFCLAIYHGSFFTVPNSLFSAKTPENSSLQEKTHIYIIYSVYIYKLDQSLFSSFVLISHIEDRRCLYTSTLQHVSEMVAFRDLYVL